MLAMCAIDQAYGQAADASDIAQAGTISLAEGSARIAPASGPARPARVGDVVRAGDSLITGSDGEVHVNMRDAGFIAVRPNTRLRIAEYKADGGADDRSVLQLLVGGFRSITGWIGKHNPNAYRVRTPTATIGVRGTDHEPRYIPEGSQEGEAGSYDRVFAGATSIESDGATTEVAPDQAGFAPPRGRGRPRVLAQIPPFFRPGPHEAEIAQKHLEIQRQIDQRRDERRKVLADRRTDLKAAQDRVREQRKEETGASGWTSRADRNQDLAARRERANVASRLNVINRRLSEIRIERDAIEADVSPEARRANFDRLRALNQENQALNREHLELEQKRRALEARQEAREAEQTGRSNESEEMRRRREEAQRARRDMRDERDSANDEIRNLRQEERRRFQNEVRKDRKSGTSEPATPPTSAPTGKE